LHIPGKIREADDMAHDHLETVQDDDRVERELVIPAGAEEVWQIVTGEGWLADEVAWELVPGGDARFTTPESTRTGWVEEVLAPHAADDAARLVFWWENDGESASRVELVLEPLEDGATRLRVSETRPLEVLDVTGIPLPGSGSHHHGPSLLAVA
jgi:hypothetical protein